MNAPQTAALFRTEVLAARREKLHGDIMVALPTSWQAIGFLLAFGLVAALTFLALAPYARIEVVSGAVVIDKGTSAIVPSRPGVVDDLRVREGQPVARGQLLATVRAEEDPVSGASMTDQVLGALLQQEQDLGSQSSLLLGASEAERARLAASGSGIAEELASLDRQIAQQKQLVAMSEGELGEVEQVAEKGFLSRRDLENRQALLLARNQQLAQLQQLRSAKQASLAESRRAMIQSEAATRAQVAAVQAQRSGLAQQRAQAGASRGYALTAPVDGTVTALTARLGQPATSGQSLMTIVPKGGQIRVELQVPTRAAGFLEKGQAVRLAIDAFPYQQFGTVPAKISEISSAAVLARTGETGTMPVYLVTADLQQPFVTAFGKRQALVPGMTLTGRIIVRRQSLLEWLFEPLIAVRRR